MFISSKELKEIRKTIAEQAEIIKALAKDNKKQKELNKKYDEALGKHYVHEQFEEQRAKEKESASILDEWLNGAKKEAGK